MRARRRVCISAATPAFAVLLAASCARVDPRPDYDRTAQQLTERTGSLDVFDPAADDAAIQHKVRELLDGGLTIEEAVRVALLNNWSFQMLFAQIGASRADVVQSGLLSNPSLGLTVRFPEGGGRSNLMLSFAQQLVDLWQIPVRRKIAEADLERVVSTAVHRGVEIAAEARTRSIDLLARTRAERIARENVVLVRHSFELAQQRFRAGETSQLDVLLVRASLLNEQLKLIQLGRDRRIAELALARTLGLSRWALDWKLVDVLPADLLVLCRDDALLAAALEQRLDAQAAAMQVRSAEEAVVRQVLAVFPDVTLGVELERLERRALPGRRVLADSVRSSVAAGAPTVPEIESRQQRSLARRQIIDSLLGPSLTITLPLWDQNQAQIAKARFEAIQRRKEYESLLDAVAQDVLESAVRARAGAEQVRFYLDQLLPQAEANIAAARRAYQAGEQSVLVVIQAQQLLIEQRLAFVGIQREYAVAAAELARSLGGRLPASVTTRPASTQAAEPAPLPTPNSRGEKP